MININANDINTLKIIEVIANNSLKFIDISLKIIKLINNALEISNIKIIELTILSILN